MLMDKRMILDKIKPGMRILEGGAGNLSFAQEMAEKGAVVTAVDIRQPSTIPSGVDFKKADIIDFRPDIKYDVIVLLNVLQFCEKTAVLESLLPRLLQALMHGGLLCIETFSAVPEPPLPITVRSVYSTQDFVGEGEVVFESDGTESVTQDGVVRMFHYLDYVFRKA